MALNRALREQVVAADASRGEVLDDVFRGVDRIEESEAGRSFRGFYELLLDPQASARLDDDLESVLAREVGSGLDWEDRRFLIGWRQLLVAESGSVRATMTGFSRALNAFVRSRLFEEHRRLTQEVRRAQLLASRVARQTRPGTAALADETLLLTGMTPGLIAGWRLRDPSELVVDEHVETHEVQPVDMELVRAVMRETEIDMGELSEAVAAALAGASGRRPARRRPRGRTAPARADALGAGRLGGTDPQRPATGAGASALGLGAHTAGGCPLTRSSGAASGRCDCLPGGLMPLR